MACLLRKFSRKGAKKSTQRHKDFLGVFASSFAPLRETGFCLNLPYRAGVKQMVLECEVVEVLIMEEGRDPVREVAQAVCDGLNQIGDFSYAMMPREIAHALGDLKKAVLGQVRRYVDWETNWIDDRVAGGDRLREEWQQKCRQS